MQMNHLLPKVEQFFSLTADWVSFSFTRHEANLIQPEIIRTPTSPVFPPSQDSTSEKEEEVLSFKPRRRGSRTVSPTPSINFFDKSSEERFISSSSSSGSDSTVNTALTSLGGSQTTLKRRSSPNEPITKMGGGPLQRVLNEEMDGLPMHSRRTSDPSRPSAIMGNSSQGDSVRSRRASDAPEDAVAASAFVETSDLLKRRREDAVLGLGSALDTSDDEPPDTDDNLMSRK